MCSALARFTRTLFSTVFIIVSLAASTRAAAAEIWAQQGPTIYAVDQPYTVEQFGYAMAIDGSTAVIGAPTPA